MGNNASASPSQGGGQRNNNGQARGRGGNKFAAADNFAVPRTQSVRGRARQPAQGRRNAGRNQNQALERVVTIQPVRAVQKQQRRGALVQRLGNQQQFVGNVKQRLGGRGNQQQAIRVAAQQTSVRTRRAQGVVANRRAQPQVLQFTAQRQPRQPRTRAVPLTQRISQALPTRAAAAPRRLGGAPRGVAAAAQGRLTRGAGLASRGQLLARNINARARATTRATAVTLRRTEQQDNVRANRLASQLAKRREAAFAKAGSASATPTLRTVAGARGRGSETVKGRGKVAFKKGPKSAAQLDAELQAYHESGKVAAV